MKIDDDIDFWTATLIGSYLGKPYRWGGDDPMAGFDCSGLVIDLLQSSGILPNKFDTTAQGLYNRFSDNVNGVRAINARFGSLCFYGKSVSRVTHVGFCIDNYRIVNAGGGGSRTTTTADAVDQNAFIKIRPLNYRQDLVAICHPNNPYFF